jgi:hypothetical protein
VADKVEPRPPQQIIRQYKRELAKELRAQGRRVMKEIKQVAPKRSGNLRRKVKQRVKWDANGPYVRITTSARRVTKNEKTGKVTTFRYGLAIQQREHYLQRGLNRTPRR